MTQHKGVWHAVGITVFVMIPSPCDGGQPKTLPNGAQVTRESRADSVARSQHETHARRPRIVGKGAELGKGADLSLAFVHSGTASASRYLEFARKNPGADTADEALLYVAETLITSKQYEQALVLLDVVIQRYPNSANLDMGACFDLTGGVPRSDHRKTQAGMAIARHINDHPNFTADIAVRCKALVYEELGERTAAIKLLSQYVERHPKGRWASEDAKVRPSVKPFNIRYRTDEILFCQLAWLYHDSGNHGKAAEVLAQAIRTFAGSPSLVFYYDLLALVHQKMGKPTNEADSLLRAKKLLEQGYYTMLLHQLANPDSNKPDLLSYEHIWLRIRSPKKINERLRELRGPRKGDRRAY